MAKSSGKGRCSITPGWHFLAAHTDWLAQSAATATKLSQLTRASGELRANHVNTQTRFDIPTHGPAESFLASEEHEK